MANDFNQCTFTGRLGKDPESKAMPSGEAVTTFSIAVGKQWKDKDSGDKKEITTWVNIVAYGKLAEISRDYLTKGKQVLVSGEFRVRKWEDKDGQTRYATDIVADKVQMLGSRSDGDSGGGREQQNGGSRPAAAPAPRQQAPQRRPADDMDSDIPF